MRLHLAQTLVLAGFLCGIPAGCLVAQQPLPDRVEIMKFDWTKWPVIPIEIDVYCNNQQQYTYDAIRIYEDGDLKVLSVSNCENYYYKNNLGFIIDRSGSQESRLNGIKTGLREFVKLYLQGSSFIASFAMESSIDVGETTNKAELIDQIDLLRSSGMTKLWEGVDTCLDASTGSVKDVLLITDGGINGGLNTAHRVIEKAKKMYVRIHVLSMGSIAPAQDTLRMVAKQTGGKFIHIPDGFYPDVVAASLGTWLREGYIDSLCTYKYATDCADGQRREVMVEVDACGKTLRDFVYYYAPYDITRPHTLVEIGNDTIFYGQNALIPVTITDVWQPNRIKSFDFTIRVPDEFTIIGVSTDGCALDGNSGFTAEIKPPIVHVMLTEELKIYPITTKLFNLELAVSEDVEKAENAELHFIADRMRLDDCILYRTAPGRLGGLKKGIPQISCETDSIHAMWIKEESRYEPEVFDMRIRVTNPTPIPITNPYVTITLPPELELLDGPPTRPVGDGPLMGTEYLSFRVRPLTVQTRTSLDVCFESGGDSTDATQCCTTVLLEPALPNLDFWCEVPESILWDEARAAYVPEDFLVTVFVANNGGIPARDVELRIDVPESCMLRTWYRPEVMMKPEVLLPGDTAKYAWKVVPLARFSDEWVEFRTAAVLTEDRYDRTCTVFIPAGLPRAELVCGNAKSLYYNDTTQTYSPDLFVVSADLVNTSRLPIWHVRAELTLPPFLHFQPGDGPLKMLDIDPLWPGISRKIYWLLYANGPPIEDAEVCMRVWAPDFPGDTCCIPISTRNTMQLLPELVCTLDLPDTIRFTEGGYTPNPFTVNVSVLNLGDTTAGMVHVALHQGADLSLASTDTPLKLVATALGIGNNAQTAFSLGVLDRSTSRFDTVRISAYSENGGAVVCQKVIWIEAVQGPILELQCTGPDSLTFDDATLSYIPSPFTVHLAATNTGTAVADSIVAEYLAGPNMALIAGESAAKMLVPQQLGVNQQGAAQWTVAALPRSKASTDTLRLQVTSVSKLLDAVIPCPLTVHVPAVRTPELTIACRAPEMVVVEGRRYLPDPLTFHVEIASTGNAGVYDIEAEATTFSRLIPAVGDAKIKHVPFLKAQSGMAAFTWDFHPVPSTLADTVDVVFRVRGRFLTDVYCVARVYLPPVPPISTTTDLTCSGPDTVRGDEALRQYPNPVLLRSWVTNTGNALIDTVIATLHLPVGVVLARDETGTRTLVNLLPAETRMIEWGIDVVEDTSTVLKERLVRVRIVSKSDVRSCDVPIIVLPFQSHGMRALDLQCSAPDTIRYNSDTRTMEPAWFPVRATVTNTGVEPLSGVTAVLTYPGRFILADGETVQKTVAALLQPGYSADVQWMCAALVRTTYSSAVCTVSASATSVLSEDCGTVSVVEGYSPRVTFEVAAGNLVGFGQTVRVPVSIANPGAHSFTEFRHTIAFDHHAVSLVNVSNKETLSKFWSPPTLSESQPGIVALSYRGEAPVIGSGVVYDLVFTGVADVGYGPFDVVTTDVAISGPEQLEGVAVTYIGGDITTSGSCVIPLNAGEGFVLEQNAPNPFNPVTTITYRIPALANAVRTVVEVFDAYGRTLRRYDEGLRNGGTFSVEFDATGLESGMYFYRLRAGNRIQTRKMLYMK